MLIHAPVRAFMILPLGVLFPYNLFVTLGWTWSPGEPQHYADHQWTGLGVMLGVNLLSMDLNDFLATFKHDLIISSRSCRCRVQTRHRLVRRSELDRREHMGTQAKTIPRLRTSPSRLPAISSLILRLSAVDNCRGVHNRTPARAGSFSIMGETPWPTS